MTLYFTWKTKMMLEQIYTVIAAYICSICQRSNSFSCFYMAKIKGNILNSCHIFDWRQTTESIYTYTNIYCDVNISMSMQLIHLFIFLEILYLPEFFFSFRMNTKHFYSPSNFFYIFPLTQSATFDEAKRTHTHH